jgi:hypothetical protein
VRISDTVRGLAIVVVVAAIITALQLDDIVAALFLVVQIAFILAIAWFLYRLWRERREEISTWSVRAKLVFYGGAVLALVDIGLAFALDYPANGLEALGFFFVLAACFFSMWRVWRDQHTYGY